MGVAVSLHPLCSFASFSIEISWNTYITHRGHLEALQSKSIETLHFCCFHFFNSAAVSKPICSQVQSSVPPLPTSILASPRTVCGLHSTCVSCASPEMIKFGSLLAPRDLIWTLVGTPNRQAIGGYKITFYQVPSKKDIHAEDTSGAS